jgi:hypothetical protein
MAAERRSGEDGAKIGQEIAATRLGGLASVGEIRGDTSMASVVEGSPFIH